MITFSSGNIYWIDRLRPRNILNLSSSARDFENDNMSSVFILGRLVLTGTNAYFAIKRAPKFYDMTFTDFWICAHGSSQFRSSS